jgi:hypothetical protein
MSGVGGSACGTKGIAGVETPYSLCSAALFSDRDIETDTKLIPKVGALAKEILDSHTSTPIKGEFGPY